MAGTSTADIRHRLSYTILCKVKRPVMGDNAHAQLLLRNRTDNFPTSLRLLVLTENHINPKLQQRMANLLTEGDEKDNRRGPPLQLHPVSSSTPTPIRDKKPPLPK
ncbi:uncharacterized protein lrrc73 [Dunckerocampus dactyliophorus]|uniref:uncharacterized protein lrrc73 n=1 Tax=Dunckerocampus dactyliophorus TaxID=161453 RepID=UPI002404FACA|nr:uncharacterized protein lrrc73 [Dunckerocampus dactyliophorus]